MTNSVRFALIGLGQPHMEAYTETLLNMPGVEIHAQALEQTRVRFEFAGCDHLIVDRHQHGLIEIPAPVCQRMRTQCFGHILPASNQIQHMARQVFFIGGEEMSFSPEFSTFRVHTHHQSERSE